MKKLLYIIIFILCLILSIFTILNYDGNKILYLFFTLISFIYPIHSILRKTFILDTYLSIFIWLGFWFKFSITISFFDSVFPEGIGNFDQSAEAYDRLLFISSFAIFLLIFFSYFANYFCLYKTSLIRKKKSLGLFYANNKKLIFLSFLFLVVLVNLLNYQFNVHQKGIISNYELSFLFTNLIKFLLMIGLPGIGIMILSAELYETKNLTISTYLLILISSLITNVSMMSRAMIFNSTFILYGLWRSKNKILRKNFYKFILLMLLITLISIFCSHNLRSHNIYNFNKLVKLDADNKIKNVAARNNYFEELIHLVRSRFIGIDSLMAVMSHENLNNDIMLRAFRENVDKKDYNFFTKEFNMKSKKKFNVDKLNFKDNVYAIAIPGFVAFSYYSGSLYIMTLFLLVFYILGIVIEYYAFKLSRKNLIVTSFIAGILAYRFMHFGYIPKNSYALIIGIILFLITVYIFEIILIKYYKRKET